MCVLGIKCTRRSHCQVKCSHWQYKFPLPVKVVATARRLKMPLPEVCTAIEEKKKKLPVKDRWQSLERNFDLRRISYNHISHLLSNSQKEMDHQYPTVAKIPVLDTGKFEQWQFRIQQYLHQEHYALWEVIEFGDSYKVPTNTDPDDTTTKRDAEQSGRTVTFTTEDMQKKKNDVKARTTLLLSLPDEHQLRFSKYKTAKELWAAILKTFSGNEATKKRKKNLLKQQYGNFKAEGTETLEQTFTDYKNDLDSMSLDDLYNHLKVYEAEVQKKSNSNSQDMAFISSLKNSSNEDGNTINGNEDGNIACVSTSSTIFPTASASVATISQDTASACIASQSNGSQIKFKDINQIDKDDMEEMDIKWNMALLSMRADKFWKRTGKKISIQGSDVTGFDKSKVECFNSKEKTPKALMAIDGVGWDWSYMANEREDHALVVDEEASTEFALMANTESKELEELKLEKDGLDGKLAGLLKASKNLDHLIESQRPSPTVASTSAEGQNKDSSTSEDVTSPNTPKPFVKFVNPKDSQSESKTDKHETPKKPQVKYAEQYRHSNKKPKVKGNQRNWNNLKSYQLGPEFVLKKKACYNCGDFSHLANDCRNRVQRETSRLAGHRPHGPSMNPIRPNMNGARPNISFFIQAPSYEMRPFLKSSAVKTQYRAPWVPTVNRNNPPVNRKFSTGRRNFPTVNRKFPPASRNFTTGSTKIHTADMGKKGKAVKLSACWTWNPSQKLSNIGQFPEQH
nr:hypothetical protein [Tanacetum cinerariifolium]